MDLTHTHGEFRINIPDSISPSTETSSNTQAPRSPTRNGFAIFDGLKNAAVWSGKQIHSHPRLAAWTAGSAVVTGGMGAAFAQTPPLTTIASNFYLVASCSGFAGFLLGLIKIQELIEGTYIPSDSDVEEQENPSADIPVGFNHTVEEGWGERVSIEMLPPYSLDPPLEHPSHLHDPTISPSPIAQAVTHTESSADDPLGATARRSVQNL